MKTAINRFLVWFWSFWAIVAFVDALMDGKVDGYLHPVVTPAEITEVRIDPENERWVVISGYARKLRPTCYPRRLEWFRGVRGGADVYILSDWRKPDWIDDGTTFTFDDWKVRAVPEEVIRENSYADVLHQCRLFGFDYPWLTRSRFWN